MIAQIPPGLILIVGALLLPLLPAGTVRKTASLLAPLLGLIHVWLIPDGTTLSLQVLEYELTPVRVDDFSRVFGIVFHLAALLASVYQLHLSDAVQQAAAPLYAGCAAAAVFAADLISLFVFWEGTAIASVFLIWAKRDEQSYRVGMRYLVIQVLSGVLLLAGSLMHFRDGGSLHWIIDGRPFGGLWFENWGDAKLGQLLILAAFGIKAAFPLLHSWLPDAYPEATPTGTVWLSAFTTKLAVYALARGFAHAEWLIPIGVVMALWPSILATVEDDLRKLLAYALNTQLGYMVVGAGIGTPLALNGVGAHAFGHILYKGLLFMAIGAVLYRVGTARASELGGLWRKMPYTAAFCVIGCLAVSFPGFCGYVGKGMIITAAGEEHLTGVFVLLELGAAWVFLHTSLRLPWAAFFAPPPAGSLPEVAEAPRSMLAAMAGAAFCCIAVGLFPHFVYDLLPFETDYHAYSVGHVLGSLQMLLGATVAFVVALKFGLLSPRAGVLLDSDWLYRVGAPAVIRTVGGAAVGAWASMREWLFGAAKDLAEQVRRWHSPGGPLGEPWPIGTAALAAACMLIAFLVLGYL